MSRSLEAVPPSLPPLAAGASAAGSSASSVSPAPRGAKSLVTPLVDVYYELCKRYSLKPQPEVTIALRFDRVHYLQLESAFGPADLLPLSEVLKVRRTPRVVSPNTSPPTLERGARASRPPLPTPANTSMMKVSLQWHRPNLPVGGLCVSAQVDRSITALDFRRCCIGNHGCYVLQEILERNDAIRFINLSHNDVGEHGALALAKGLEKNTSVERLLLGSNRIGFLGAQALARVVRKHPTLRYLDVSSNSLRMRGVQELHLALQARRRAAQRKRLQAGGDVPRLRQRRVPSSGGGTRGGGNGGGAGVAGGGGRVGSAGPDGDGLEGGSSDEEGEYDFELDFEADDRGGRFFDDDAPPEGRDDEGAGGIPWELARRHGGADGVEIRWSGNFVQEEIANGIIHGVGFVLAIFGSLPLLQRARMTEDGAYFVGVVCYLVGLLGFYLAATLRHSLYFLETTSRILHVIDRSAIYILIAGTYTPFTLVNLDGVWMGRAVLALSWALALFGVFLSTTGDAALRFGRGWRHLRLSLYVGMGWIGLILFKWVWECVDPHGLYLLAGGGVVYTAGAINYLRQRTAPGYTGFQTLWYLLVVLASVAHYVAIYSYVERRCEAGVIVRVADAALEAP